MRSQKPTTAVNFLFPVSSASAGTGKSISLFFFAINWTPPAERPSSFKNGKNGGMDAMEFLNRVPNLELERAGAFLSSLV